jgi:hypothetical protein
VTWPTRRLRPSLFILPTAIAVATERAFVVHICDGAVEWVDVKRGASKNHQGVDLAPIFSDLELEIRSQFAALLSSERAQM